MTRIRFAMLSLIALLCVSTATAAPNLKNAGDIHPNPKPAQTLFAYETPNLDPDPQTAPSHNVTLSCTAGAADATHDAATSFNFKRSTTTGGPYTTVGTSATCAFVDNSVSTGQKFFYVATGVNSGGESSASNEVSAIIPSFPPTSPTALGATPK